MMCVGYRHERVLLQLVGDAGPAANLALLLRYAAVCCCVRPERRYTLPEDLNPGLKGNAA